MTDEYLLKQCYSFESFRKKVQTTPLNEIFTREEIIEIESLGIEPHCCHSNSADVALHFGCLYCEGLINSHIPHAFNSIERNGSVYYFDVTNYINLKLEPGCLKDREEIELRRVFAAGEIADVFDDFEHSFITFDVCNSDSGIFHIEEDGTVSKMSSEEYCKRFNEGLLF